MKYNINKICFLQIDGRDSPSSSNNDRAPSNEFGSCTDGKCIKRTSQDITSGMWFGPRLGRRRRADRKPEINSDIEALANAFEEPHWAIVTIPGIFKIHIFIVSRIYIHYSVCVHFDDDYFFWKGRKKVACFFYNIHRIKFLFRNRETTDNTIHTSFGKRIG